MVIFRIVEQHAEEAAFLWTQRDAAVGMPHYNLRDLTKLDSRVEAHLDGLRVAGDHGWELCVKSLELETPGELFVCAVLAFESAAQARVETVLELAAKSCPLARAVASALAWIGPKPAEQYIRELTNGSNSMRQSIALTAAAGRRFRLEGMRQAFSHDCPAVRARACRTAAELGGRDHLHLITALLNDAEESCRFWASWSVARLTPDHWAIEQLRSSVTCGSGASAKAVQLYVRREDPKRATEFLHELMNEPRHTRLAANGAGALGVPDNVEWLISLMKDYAFARVAAEAFTMITGADIIAERLLAEKPQDVKSGPTDNPGDDDIAMDADHRLPWPNQHVIEQWWVTHRSLFILQNRYLLGKPMTVDWLTHVLRTGRQHERSAAALELALGNFNEPLFNVKMEGTRQMLLLGMMAMHGLASG